MNTNTQVSPTEILQLAKSLKPLLLEWRNHLHQFPELSFKEYHTQQWIFERLQEMNLPAQIQKIAGTGIAGIVGIESSNKPVFWLRADIDALPIQESEDKSVISQNAGIMHACGHDVHTTCLLGALYILNKIGWPNRVQVGFIFQPGEEVLPGGALSVIQSGIFDLRNNAGIVALHVYPSLDAGSVGFATGSYMASSDEIHITINGPGGHAAAPHETSDTVLTAASLIVQLQQISSRLCPPDIPCVLTFGSISAPGATNIIPSEVKIGGTFRTMDETWRNNAHQHIQRICLAVAKTHQVTISCEIKLGYPVLVNHTDLTHKIRSSMESLLGKENVKTLPKRMASEDFAQYTHIMPGCFFRLGTGGPENNNRHSVHTPRFDINPDALPIGAAALAVAAISSSNG